MNVIQYSQVSSFKYYENFCKLGKVSSEPSKGGRSYKGIWHVWMNDHLEIATHSFDYAQQKFEEFKERAIALKAAENLHSKLGSNNF